MLTVMANVCWVCALYNYFKGFSTDSLLLPPALSPTGETEAQGDESYFPRPHGKKKPDLRISVHIRVYNIIST